MQIIGELEFENNQCYVKTPNHRVNLFSWLASHGLKDKAVHISVTRGIERDGNTYFVEEGEDKYESIC